MNTVERRATFSLALIFSFRMLGLFMILPVFTLYADDLGGASHTLIGLAIGIYGLSQAALQIPFGLWSDKIGRKPIIVLGLVLFAAGSVVAALSTSIYGVILGRCLQGSGAIGSTTMALLSDLTSEKNRTKAIAMMGMVIGLSFFVAMILGPVLNSVVHVSGLFWLTAGLALVGIVVLFTVVPSPTSDADNVTSDVRLLKTVLRDPKLLRLDFGIFILHAILTASFVVVPVMLHQAGLAEHSEWRLFAPVLALSFVCMLPLIILAEKTRHARTIFLGSITAIGVAQFLLYSAQLHLVLIAAILLLFFTAFTLLEASLPSMISKSAPSSGKGTALGVYSSCQFLGIFTGGTLGGWLYGQLGVSSVFSACGVLALLWLVTASGMTFPKQQQRTRLEESS